MKVKQIYPINFLFHRAEVKMSDLPSMFPFVKQIFKDAVSLDLHVTGAIHWHYEGLTGDHSKAFVLEILLPVATIPAEYNGVFQFKRTDSVNVLETRHEGAWEELPKTYASMAKFAREHELTQSGILQEIYINSDFANGKANSTDVRMELK